jgi:hypothetical protein
MSRRVDARRARCGPVSRHQAWAGGPRGCALRHAKNVCGAGSDATHGAAYVPPARRVAAAPPAPAAGRECPRTAHSRGNARADRQTVVEHPGLRRSRPQPPAKCHPACRPRARRRHHPKSPARARAPAAAPAPASQRVRASRYGAVKRGGRRSPRAVYRSVEPAGRSRWRGPGAKRIALRPRPASAARAASTPHRLRPTCAAWARRGTADRSAGPWRSTHRAPPGRAAAPVRARCRC